MVFVHFNTHQIALSKANVPDTRSGAMSRNARNYLSQAGSPAITTKVFPENESDGTQLS